MATNSEAPRRWDDPAFWDSISVDYCRACGRGSVLRHGVCWDCRHLTPTTQEETR